MSRDIELIALIDLIYEATLNSDLWPRVVLKLAALALGQRAERERGQ